MNARVPEPSLDPPEEREIPDEFTARALSEAAREYADEHPFVSVVEAKVLIEADPALWRKVEEAAAELEAYDAEARQDDADDQKVSAYMDGDTDRWGRSYDADDY